jgi:hypothetical protein
MRHAGIAALSGRPLRDFSTTVKDAADACWPCYIKLNARDNVAIIVNDFGPWRGPNSRAGSRAQNAVG